MPDEAPMMIALFMWGPAGMRPGWRDGSRAGRAAHVQGCHGSERCRSVQHGPRPPSTPAGSTRVTGRANSLSASTNGLIPGCEVRGAFQPRSHACCPAASNDVAVRRRCPARPPQQRDQPEWVRACSHRRCGRSARAVRGLDHAIARRLDLTARGLRCAGNMRFGRRDREPTPDRVSSNARRAATTRRPRHERRNPDGEHVPERGCCRPCAGRTDCRSPARADQEFGKKSANMPTRTIRSSMERRSSSIRSRPSSASGTAHARSPARARFPHLPLRLRPACTRSALMCPNTGGNTMTTIAARAAYTGR